MRCRCHEGFFGVPPASRRPFCHTYLSRCIDLRRSSPGRRPTETTSVCVSVVRNEHFFVRNEYFSASWELIEECPTLRHVGDWRKPERLGSRGLLRTPVLCENPAEAGLRRHCSVEAVSRKLCLGESQPSVPAHDGQSRTREQRSALRQAPGMNPLPPPLRSSSCYSLAGSIDTSRRSLTTCSRRTASSAR
jgi:hypothetical protein